MGERGGEGEGGYVESGLGGHNGMRMGAGEVEGVAGEVTGGQFWGGGDVYGGSTNAFWTADLTRVMRAVVGVVGS